MFFGKARWQWPLPVMCLSFKGYIMSARKSFSHYIIALKTVMSLLCPRHLYQVTQVTLYRCIFYLILTCVYVLTLLIGNPNGAFFPLWMIIEHVVIQNVLSSNSLNVVYGSGGGFAEESGSGGWWVKKAIVTEYAMLQSVPAMTHIRCGSSSLW